MTGAREECESIAPITESSLIVTKTDEDETKGVGCIPTLYELRGRDKGRGMYPHPLRNRGCGTCPQQSKEVATRTRQRAWDVSPPFTKSWLWDMSPTVKGRRDEDETKDVGCISTLYEIVGCGTCLLEQ
jgi:hypothetical protein